MLQKSKFEHFQNDDRFKCKKPQFVQNQLFMKKYHTLKKSTQEIKYLKIWLSIFILIHFLNIGHCTNVTITSQSNVTGQLSDYYFIITNHSNPTQLIIQFSAWSVNDPQPYNSDYQIKENSTLSILNCSSFGTGTIRCLITNSIFTGSVYPSTINLVMTNIYNPSSTKPYLITFYPKKVTTEIVRAYLTMNTPLSSGIVLLNYNYNISAISNNVSVLVQFDNYIDSNSIMNLTYDNNLINISMNSGSFYNVITNNGGLKQITGWSGMSLGTAILSSIQIINPSFSFSYIINGLLYFVQNGTIYMIQQYTVTITLIPISFTTLSSTSDIIMGTSNNSIIVSDSCSISPINKGANQTAYILITYDSTLMSINSSSLCVFNSNTSCIIKLITSNFNFDKIASLIPSSNISNISIRATIYSYFSYKNQFYPTCDGSFTVNLVKQTLTSSTSLIGCNSQVLGSNNLQITFTGQSITSGDYLSIQNLLGTLNSSSIIWTYDNTTISYNTLINSSFLTISSSYVTVNFSLLYINPTYTSSNSIIIKLYHNGIQYGSGTLTICTINNPYVKSSILSINNSSTFAKSKYIIQMGLTINDYKVNDYVVIKFMNSKQYQSGNTTVQTTSSQSSSQLYYPISNNQSLSINLNSLIIPYLIVNSSSIRLMFNSTTLISSILSTSSLSISISNLSNTIGQGYTKIYLVTYNSNNQQKQSTISNSVWISASTLIISSNSIITLLQQNNISLILNQPYRTLISSDSSVLSTILELNSPFSCMNTNSTTLIADFIWAKSLTSYTADLLDCSLSYFTDMSKTIIIKQYIQYSTTSGNVTTNYTVLTTSSIYYVSSTCGDDCYHCASSTSNCTACFNNTYNSLIYLYQGACYSSCPSGSYLDIAISSVTCNTCHAICSTCLYSNYDNCSSCAKNYIFNSNSICQSICGQNQYYIDSTGSCQNCDPNCKGCINSTNCYLCKEGAILIDTLCIFASCTSPCKTCQGSLTTCTSCVTNQSTSYYLYSNICYTTCPDETYSDNLICTKISTVNLYFPCIILTVVLLLIAFGLKCFSPKNIKKSQLNLNQTVKSINESPKYKINILRCLAVSLSLAQLLSVIIILFQGSKINPTGVNQTIIVGLIIYFFCNIIFGVGFYKKVVKRQKKYLSSNIKHIKQKIQNQDVKINQSQNSQNQSQKDQELQMLKKYEETYNLRQLVIVGLSCCFSFRFYRLLQANVFSQENSLINNKRCSSIQKSLNASNNQLLFNSQTALKQSSRQNIEKQQKKSVNKVRKTLPNLIKVQSKDTNKQNKIIKNQTVNLSIINENQTSLHKLNKLQEFQQVKTKYRNKFLHPFYSYLCIGSFLSSSILFLIGAVLQILYKRYQNMMLWGLDSLVIIVLMYFINIWDIWRLLNLPIQSQSSQISSIQQQINNTQQNIKPREQEEQADFEALKNDFGATTKLSPKKYSPIKNKSSPKNIQDNNLIKKLSTKKSPMRKQSLDTHKSKSPSEKTQKIKNRNNGKNSQRSFDDGTMQEYQDEIPKLKIFDDIQGQKQLQKGQKLKKWNVTMHPKMRNSTQGLGRYPKNMKSTQISKTSRNKGWKLQDIYLGFLQMQQSNQQVQMTESNNDNDETQTVQINNNFANVNIAPKKSSNSVVNIQVLQDENVQNQDIKVVKVQNEYWEQQKENQIEEINKFQQKNDLKAQKKDNQQ